MPDTGESFLSLENLLSVTLTGSLAVAPMHSDRLLIIALYDRYSHPNFGFASLCIPAFDLVGQWFTLGGKADVLTPGLRLTEIEIVRV